MQRRKVIAHLAACGCVFKREGSSHTIYVNPANGRTTAVPRHNEIDDKLVQKICVKDLGIVPPRP